MIACMTIDDHVRSRLREMSDAGTLSQTALGKYLKLSQQAVGQYLDGTTKRWPFERILKAEEFVRQRLRPPDEPGPSPGQAGPNTIQSYAGPPLRLVPAVDIRRYPRGWKRGSPMQELRDRQYGVRETQSQDPDAHYIRIDEKVGRRGEPGDEALVSPAYPPVDGDFVAIDCEMGVKVGRFTDLGDRRYVELTASGQRVHEFSVIGTVLKLSFQPQ